MILKPVKPPNEKTSYQPISLLPVISKVFEKLLLKRLKPIIQEKRLIPPQQFCFHNKHSRINKVDQLINTFEKSLDEKVCSPVFLDVAQAYDKVWHCDLNGKLKAILPKKYIQLLKLYLTDRHFRVWIETEYSDLWKITAGVCQGSVLGLILYLL